MFQEYKPLDLNRLSNEMLAPVDETSHVIDLHLGQNLSDAVSNMNEFIDIFGGKDSHCLIFLMTKRKRRML